MNPLDKALLKQLDAAYRRLEDAEDKAVRLRNLIYAGTQKTSPNASLPRAVDLASPDLRTAVNRVRNIAESLIALIGDSELLIGG